jgi:hypothetical protein
MDEYGDVKLIDFGFFVKVQPGIKLHALAASSLTWLLKSLIRKDMMEGKRIFGH